MLKTRGRRKKYIRLKRIFGVSAILLAILIWNVPAFVRAAGTATLLPGRNVNILIKQLADSSADSAAGNENYTIKRIEWNNAALDGTVISESGSDNPVYVKLADDDETVYIYSDADTIFTGTDASYMFCLLRGLESIDDDFMEKLNTSNATDMQWMFDYCESLTSLDVSGFNTSNVTNMQSMFTYCPKLTSLDVSGFDTSKVTDMSSMFALCQSLVSIDVSGFDSDALTEVKDMFSADVALQEIDLSSFDLSGVGDVYNRMLQGCTSLRRIETPYNTDREILLSGTYYELKDGTVDRSTSYTSIPAGLTESITLMLDGYGPTASPAVTSTPTATATATPTTTPTVTPTSSTATPTRTTAPTAAPTARPTATSAATATARPTATSAATPTARPTATTAGTATPIPWPNANGGTGSNQTYVYNGSNGAYNPNAVVYSNANDMPRTGDGDAARLIVVAVLFIVGCIALVSSIPTRRSTT